MNDEQYLESLKKDARELRYEPVDPFALERIRARIAERLEPRDSAFDQLTAWWRTIAAALAAAAVALSIGLYSLDSSQPLDLLGQADAQRAMLSEGVFGVE